MVYQTRHISGLATLLMILATVAIIVSDFVLVALLQTKGLITLCLLLLPVILLVYLLKYFRQKIEVETMHDRIKVRYLSKPFCDRVNDREILISDIVSCTISEGGRGRYFTLHLIDSSEFNCTVGAVGDTKDFDELAAALEVAIENKKGSD